MAYYTFNQNNTDGYFKEPAEYIIIEANSAIEANNIAKNNGIYFDGVNKKIDCECCGDRWWKVNENDAKKKPTIYNKLANKTNYNYKIIEYKK